MAPLQVLLLLFLLSICKARRQANNTLARYSHIVCADIDWKTYMPPKGDDCMDLAMKLHHAGNLPGGRAPKEWGHHLNNTATTMSLPKLYWIAGDGPKECGVQVDIDLQTPDATDMLSLWDINHGAGQVIICCLYGQGILGLYRAGAQRRIEVKVVKIHKTGLLRVDEEEDIDAGDRGVLRASKIGVLDMERRAADDEETESMRGTLLNRRLPSRTSSVERDVVVARHRRIRG